MKCSCDESKGLESVCEYHTKLIAEAVSNAVQNFQNDGAPHRTLKDYINEAEAYYNVNADRNRRAERLQVASLVLAALVPRYVEDQDKGSDEPPQLLAKAAVLFADALIARVDAHKEIKP